jgi:LPXTG-motif cell wall-anchored protein
VGAGTFGGGKVAAVDDPTNWYLIGGIAAVVAGVAYYSYSSRRKK